MESTDFDHERFFLSYTGVKLPLQLFDELAPDALRNRNTWFRARYAADGRMLCCEKFVYGEVEMRHDYLYDAEGQLCEAHVKGPDEDEDVQVLTFS
ncbi:DUF6156 family protein [Viridibacterium curvum]|uniref:Uncharacterized protein n=1 Tax=Viridibacterium curvum TaxID=1101404 RepID=A0ABP9R6G1_9RHOO